MVKLFKLEFLSGWHIVPSCSLVLLALCLLVSAHLILLSSVEEAICQLGCAKLWLISKVCSGRVDLQLTCIIDRISRLNFTFILIFYVLLRRCVQLSQITICLRSATPSSVLRAQKEV